MFSTREIYMALGLLPAVLLLFYIYKMDRIEKEPKGLLVGLFFLGVGATIPTMIVELLLSVVNNGLFFGQYITQYEYTFVDGKVYLYEFVHNFFGIALVEEGFKWLFMFLLTRKSKNFNCLFDGVVYATFVSLGFAAAENVMYVFTGGLVTGLARMVTAVPGHCAFAVVMGTFYGKWFVARNAGALEKNLYQNRVIAASPQGFGAGKFLFLSILLPTLILLPQRICAVEKGRLHHLSLHGEGARKIPRRGRLPLQDAGAYRVLYTRCHPDVDHEP